MSEQFGIDPSNVVVNVIEETLVEFIKKSIENDDINNKISIKLTPETITIIKNIIKVSPSSFLDIEKGINEVIKDGKINSKDIPQLIIIIQVLYRQFYSLQHVALDSVKRSELVSSVLKYIIRLMVLERKIKVEKENEEEFYKETDILIDSCVSLLSFQKSIKTKGCIKRFFVR